MNTQQIETNARKVLRQFGLEVEAINWIRRHGDEFAAVVVSNCSLREMEHALEVLTDPRCPLVVAREHVGTTDTRIYVAFAKTGA